MTPSVETSGYRLSPRVTLRPGDTFRVAGGPYYRLADGRRSAVPGLVARPYRVRRAGKTSRVDPRRVDA